MLAELQGQQAPAGAEWETVLAAADDMACKLIAQDNRDHGPLWKKAVAIGNAIAIVRAALRTPVSEGAGHTQREGGEAHGRGKEANDARLDVTTGPSASVGGPVRAPENADAERRIEAAAREIAADRYGERCLEAHVEDVLEVLLRHLSGALPEGRPEWRTMDSAPRDGTWILVHFGRWDGRYNPPRVVRCVSGHWYDGEASFVEPSGWIPVPAPVIPTPSGEAPK